METYDGHYALIPASDHAMVQTNEQKPYLSNPVSIRQSGFRAFNEDHGTITTVLCHHSSAKGVLIGSGRMSSASAGPT